MNKRPLRILQVLPQLPYPPNRGGKIVQYHFVRGLLERHSVWVAALIHHEDEWADAETFRKLCPNLKLFRAAPRWSPSRIAQSLFSSKPYKAHRFFSPEMADWVQQCISEQSIDVVHCQNFYTAQYVTGKEPCARVLYKENFETLLLERFVQDSSLSAWLRHLASMQVRRTKRYEVDVCARFDRVVMISEPDRQRFEKLKPAAPLDVLSPGVDLDHLRPSPNEPIDGRVVFTGSMDYFPNVDAVQYFCTEVWPKVRLVVPHAQFFIVGQRPEAAVQAWHNRDGIQVTGKVEDVLPYLAEAAVYVVPLRVGGGVRLKILEALAMGKAIVATSVGAEGLNVTNGKNIRLADDPDTMARAVVELLQSNPERQALQQQARTFAEEQGDWREVVRRLEQIYREVCRD